MDRLAEAINIIKTHERMGRAECVVDSTKLLKSVLATLKAEKYVNDFEEFKDGKFMVMNVAATDLFSIPSQNDDQVKHPVPLKFDKDGGGYRLYGGRKYVVMKAD